MKNITFQLQEIDGTVLNENRLTIGDNDTLIMTFDSTITHKTAHEIFKSINESLKSNNPIIGYPKGIELKVLKKN